MQDFEHSLEYDIQSHTRHGEEVSDHEIEAMKRELYVWEAMTVSEKGRWVEF